MKKFVIFFTIALLVSLENYGQATRAVDAGAKDSLRILQELMELFGAGKSTSYVQANVGIGNRLFSAHNNALNAKQSGNKMIYSPAIGYFHKTGFGLTATANLLNDTKRLDITQYSVSPSYELQGSRYIDLAVSYAHYFVKDKFSVYSSPIQNDFFTSIVYKKKWLQPGIALGYSTGEYKEVMVKDTAVNNAHRRLYDSITYKLNAFSIIFSVGHSYDWYGILNKNDGLRFTHTLMANAGSSKTTISHNTNARYLYNLLNKRKKIPKLQTEKFEMQSIGLGIDLYYSIGNFILEPQMYIDCYLPRTDIQRFSQVFTFNIGYNF